MNKKQASRIHAKVRADERYGIGMNDVNRNKFVEVIQGNSSAFVERQTNTKSIHYILFSKGHILDCAKVIYDKKRQEIVTFLPRDKKCSELINANIVEFNNDERKN